MCRHALERPARSRGILNLSLLGRTPVRIHSQKKEARGCHTPLQTREQSEQQYLLDSVVAAHLCSPFVLVMGSLLLSVSKSAEETGKCTQRSGNISIVMNMQD